MLSVNLPPVSVGPTCLTATIESDIEPSKEKRADMSAHAMMTAPLLAKLLLSWGLTPPIIARAVPQRV